MSAAASRFLPSFAPDQTGWGVLVSVMVHGLLVAAVLFWPSFGMSRRQIFAPSYQVQLVGAPRLPAAKPAPAPAAAAKKKPVRKAAPKPAAKPKPAPKKEAIGNKKTVKKAKLKKKKTPAPDVSKMLDSKISRLKRKVDERRRLDRAMSRIEKKVAARASNDTAGAFATGAGSSQMSMRFSIYYTEVWQRVQRAWVLPEVMVQKPGGLVAVVVMRINRDGSLSKVWLEQKSGNSRFDASALRAAERAAPYPPLPTGLRKASHEVGIRFRDEDITG